METKFKLPPLVAKMKAVGTVTNPDGTVHNIVLTAEKPLKLQENESGNHPIGSGIDRSD